MLQSPDVSYHGQIVAVVVAENARGRHGAGEDLPDRVRAGRHDVTLRADHPGLYVPARSSTPTSDRLDHRRPRRRPRGRRRSRSTPPTTTPQVHNNPMEPHATVARWDGGPAHAVRLEPGRHTCGAGRWPSASGWSRPRCTSSPPHVGGGFGAKGARPPARGSLAALAARVVGRPVKFARAPPARCSASPATAPRRSNASASAPRRRDADRDQPRGRRSRPRRSREFAEQTAVLTRHLYAAPNRRTTHRLVALDVPTPSWMRGPGESPGVFALSPRWTSSPSPSTPTRSSCASATNP